MFKKEIEVKSPRSAYGSALVDLGHENKNVVALDADLSFSTQTCKFAAEFPERFFNVGISEQDLMGTAAGLAREGKIVFASTFAIFGTGRCLDQIRNAICYQNLNVKIVATHGGLTVGEDGASHQALEDVTIMRAIPNMTVIVPSDSTEVYQAVKYAAKVEGPVYIRVPRTNLKTIFDENEYVFNPKKAIKIKDGDNLTVITNGETLGELIGASELLEKDGIKIEIIHMPVMKPFFDYETIINSAAKTKKVITVENHSIIGGLGSEICEILSDKLPTQVIRLGVNDVFGQSGEQSVLMDYYKLNKTKLYEEIKKISGK